MAIFQSEALYILSTTNLINRVAKIDEVIDALLDRALLSAGQIDVDEYSLDDGQTKIRTSYRSHTQIAEAIKDFEKIKQQYQNRITGRIVTLKDKN